MAQCLISQNSHRIIAILPPGDVPFRPTSLHLRRQSAFASSLPSTERFPRAGHAQPYHKPLDFSSSLPAQPWEEVHEDREGLTTCVWFACSRVALCCVLCT